MPQSLDVMGWEVRNGGLFVIFTKDIPTIVEKWFKPNVTEFLHNIGWEWERINHFIVHPGGKKVLKAYVKAIGINESMIDASSDVLRNYGNMSSTTVFFVFKRIMETAEKGDVGFAAALGPGFSSEMLLIRWE